ncbi:MAG: tyrosine-type recombinase/integrase [Candidatus Eisenbacteria bacterium]
MSDSIDQFAEHLGAFRRPRTVEAYRSAAKKFEEWVVGKPMTPRSLEDFAAFQLTTKKLSGATVHLLVVGVKAYLGWRRRQGEDLPDFDSPPLPRFRKRVLPVLRGEDLKSYYRACDNMPEPVRTLSLLLPLTGFRVSEACNIQVRDLKWAGNRFRITVRDSKGDDRVVPVPRRATPLVRRYLKETWGVLPKLGGAPEAQQFLFPSRLGTAYQPKVVREWMAKIRKRIGVTHLTPHVLRHTFGTRLEEAGVPTSAIARLMGHRSVQTTSGYTHGSIDSLGDDVDKI